MAAKFPKRVYTFDEVERARKLVESGYKHRLTIKGSDPFRSRVREAFKLVKIAGFYDFLRTYIGRLVEIDGFSQLHEAESAIWANEHLSENPVEAAGFFVQKAFLMKEFLQGRPYYGGKAETRSTEKRIEFLRVLNKRSKTDVVRRKCETLLRRWAETPFP
ncbi:MAG: hypothetical protein NWE81_01170 [Candidatus Bathyarchaeota archaeon]|nr:hypothetical protein [Candidatus Bathyarchaeota archaeon]